MTNDMLHYFNFVWLSLKIIFVLPYFSQTINSYLLCDFEDIITVEDLIASSQPTWKFQTIQTVSILIKAAFLEDNDTNFEEKQFILLTLSNSFKKISKQLQGFWIAAPKNGVTCCTIKIQTNSFPTVFTRSHATPHKFKLVSIKKKIFWHQFNSEGQFWFQRQRRM